MLNIIVATYNQYDAFIKMIKSLVATTPEPYVVNWIDDGSENFAPSMIEEALKICPNMQYHGLKHTGNLTAIWNYGYFKGPDSLYTCIANSDVIFSHNWWKPLMSASDEYDLIGPLTNAPGSYDNQRINNYIPNYKIVDNFELINETAAQISQQYTGETREGRIGGFFLFGQTNKFYNNRFNDEHIFNPANTLLGGEDDYQQRCKGKIGVCCDSFIFHYRSLSRDIQTVPVSLLKGMYRATPEFNVAVYSVILNDYDEPRYLNFNDKRIRHAIFMDTESTNTKYQRKFKIMSHDIWSNYDYSIWIDGNLELLEHPFKLINKYLSKYDIAFFMHPQRCCTYQEGQALKTFKYEDPKVVDTQLEKYKSEGFPFAYGLPETGMIIRKHTPAVAEFNKIWWEEVKNGSHRDQLAVGYALWKTKLFVEWIPNNIRQSPLVKYFDHNHIRDLISWGD